MDKSCAWAFLFLGACAPSPEVAAPVLEEQLAARCDLSTLSLDLDRLTRSSLTAGAFTDVPPSANAAYKSLVDGSPLHITSAITGVEFHVPGKISSAPGGLSSTPRPILKKANGVSYWFISGELSGVLTLDSGMHLVVGPIDRQGVNHRGETFCAPCAKKVSNRTLCCAPRQAAAHPRAGLPGAFFALAIPVKGFDGALVQIEPAGDGGSTYPAAPLMSNAVDPVALLERGYAVFNFGQGGTVREGTLPDGSKAIDTNPDSGSGIFWQFAREANPDENNWSGLVPYTRPAFVDDATGTETTLRSDYTLSQFDCDQVYSFTIGQPDLFWGSIHTETEIVADSVLFAKNLAGALSPCSAIDWTAYMGWSGSGRMAVLLDSNTRFGAFQAYKSTGPQAGGGGYNTWGEPSSGLRYDAYLVQAGNNDSHGYFDQCVFGNIPSDVNPRLPISAPLVWIIGDYDTALWTLQMHAYAYANKVWEALAALGRGDEINDFIRIYAVPGTTHTMHDLYLAAYDSGDPDGGLWYDYADRLPNPGAFNTEGRGVRVADAMVQVIRANDGLADPWADFDFHGMTKMPRQMPLWLQLLSTLRGRGGASLPVSRVETVSYTHLTLPTNREV